MPKLDETARVENMLHRLVPTAMSAEGQQSIDEMIDVLAAAPAHADSRVWWLGGAAAAAMAIASWLAGMHLADKKVGSIVATHLIRPDVRLVSETDQVSGVVSDGWRNAPDGSALRAVRVSAVERSELLDEESGLVVCIEQPREEVILMPITTF